MLLYAQSFTGKIEDTGDYYRLTYTVTSHDASGFTPPSLHNFDILSGPNTSTFSSYQMVNGKTSHKETTSYVYILSAKKKGKLTIDKASIKVNGKTLQSNIITFEARPGGGSQNGHSHGGSAQKGRESQDIQRAGTQITQKDVFIDLTPSRTRVKEQEAVLLTYKVHTKHNVGLSQTQLTGQPDFKGMISQEIPLPGNQIQTSLEHHNGVSYRSGIIQQYVIFPQKAGKLKIPSLSFNLTILQQREPMSLADAFFNGGGSIGVQIKRVVPTTTIDVEALPEPKPQNFNGAVGHFNIEGHLMNEEIKTNDIATFRVEVTGVGNMNLITAPKMTLPRDFETYDVKTNENIVITPEGFTGKLVYDYVFVPQNIGQYEIPSLEFVYYDPENNTYKTLRTNIQKIDVKKGKASTSDVNKQLSLLQSDIRTIHPSQEISDTNKIMVWGNMAYWGLQLILIILFVTVVFGVHRYKHYFLTSSSQRMSANVKEAMKQLERTQAQREKISSSAFCSAISQTLINFIAVSYNIKRADLNQNNIQEVLLQHQLKEEQVKAINKLIEDCQYAQYAPTETYQQEDLYSRTIEAIRLIATLK